MRSRTTCNRWPSSNLSMQREFSHLYYYCKLRVEVNKLKRAQTTLYNGQWDSPYTWGMQTTICSSSTRTTVMLVPEIIGDVHHCPCSSGATDEHTPLLETWNCCHESALRKPKTCCCPHHPRPLLQCPAGESWRQANHCCDDRQCTPRFWSPVRLDNPTYIVIYSVPPLFKALLTLYIILQFLHSVEYTWPVYGQ